MVLLADQSFGFSAESALQELKPPPASSPGMRRMAALLPAQLPPQLQGWCHTACAVGLAVCSPFYQAEWHAVHATACQWHMGRAMGLVTHSSCQWHAAHIMGLVVHSLCCGAGGTWSVLWG